MSVLHKDSYECANSDLDLFLVPPTQTSLETAKLVEHQPIAAITQSGPIEFNIIGSDDDYMDLSQTYLYLKARVKKNRNEDLDPSHLVGPVNLFLHSLFSQVDISLNGKKITPSVNTYPYRCILETLLNYGDEAKKTHLTSSYFYKDTAGKMDSLTENQGFTKKRSLNSKPFELYGRLHADICFQNRYIINNVDMNVKLIRSSNNFCLMGDNKFNYEAHIDEAILYVRKVKVSASVMLAHAMALEKTTIKYPITRVETVVYSISSGATIQTFDNISSGVLPKRVVFALVDSDAANGNYVKNCFNFKHYNFSLVSLTVDNQDVPQSPLVLNFSENNFISAYYGMFGG
jgi:hypothetical protein